MICAKKVRLRYGDSLVAWDVLGTMIEGFWAFANGNELLLTSLCKDLAGDVIKSMNCVDNLRSIRRLFDKGPLPIHDVILFSCHSEATEGRDKVLAILGLSCDADHPDLQPDHKLSIQQVYTRTTLYCLWKGSFALLSLAGVVNHSKRRSTLGLPSWVPDLTRPPLKWPLDNPQALYRAGGPPSGVQVSLESRSQLRVKGFAVGRVVAVSALLTPESELADAEDYKSLVGFASNNEGNTAEKVLAHLKSLVSTVQAHIPDPYPSVVPSASKITRLEALWRTMVGDEGFGGGGISFPAGDEVGRYFEVYMRFMALAGGTDDNVLAAFATGLQGMPTAQDMAACGIFSQLMGRKIMLRRLVVTELGYMGFGDINVQVGDSICVFLGSKTPYVVRDADEDGGKKLLGEAYLHGFMKGEVVESGSGAVAVPGKSACSGTAGVGWQCPARGDSPEWAGQDTSRRAIPFAPL